MKLAFSTTALARGLSNNHIDGIGNYTFELLKRLSKDERIDLTAFSHSVTLPQTVCELKNNPIQLPRYEISLACSLLTSLPFLGNQQFQKTVDLIHVTDHFFPKFSKTPVLATIMDAVPLSHPEWVRPQLRAVKNALWKKSASWSNHIVTISEFSKQEIQTHFHIAEEKITVIPLGVDERWFQEISPEMLQKTLAHYNLPAHYFLFVGTLQPRKNVKRIINAYQALSKNIQNDVGLVIIGNAGWESEELIAFLKSHNAKNQIRWLKYVPSCDLLFLVKKATALVFPSLYEGFGLPVLEAFAANVPVITSNLSALPEVAGDAALLINPLDENEIAWAMEKVVEDENLIKMLKDKGLQRAKHYSWNRTVNSQIALYSQLI